MLMLIAWIQYPENYFLLLLYLVWNNESNLLDTILLANEILHLASVRSDVLILQTLLRNNNATWELNIKDALRILFAHKNHNDCAVAC